MAMIKVYPCPKCKETNLIIKGGMRVECLSCWSTAMIPAWNMTYKKGVRETIELRKRFRKKGLA